MAATPNIYRYKDTDGSDKEIVITNNEHIVILEKAKTDLDNARSFFEETYYPLWREGYKMYHLSTADRGARIKKWQQNAAFGMVRSFTDVFASTLTEKPITFNVTGVNPSGIKNADNIKRALSYAADVTGFQDEVKESLKEALKTGTFAADLQWIDKKDGKQYAVAYPDAEKPEDKIKMVSFDDDEIGNIPSAKHMSVFSFYSDPYNGNNPAYVCTRKILSGKVFEKVYGTMIDSPANESPLKGIKNLLTKNTNGASFLDHETIVDMVHKEKAIQAMARDSYITTREGSVSNIVNGVLNMNSQERMDKGNIEAICVNYDDHIVLYANNYPVFIGENTLGFITQEIQSATSPKRGADCEGVGYLVGDIARLYDSFGNSHIDNVRAVADPVYIGSKGAFLDEESIQEMEPGSIQWAEEQAGQNPLRRLDKGTVSDYGMLNILFEMGTRLVGVSEYNMGVSAGERTATGSLSLSSSASRRLTPFMQCFVSFISRIARKFLIMQKNMWTDAQWVMVNGEEGDMLSNMDLQGGVIISLQMDSMIAAINEFMYKKLIEVLKETKGSGLANEDEIMREIFRSSGLDPSRFVPPTAPKVRPPETLPNETPGPSSTDVTEFIPTEGQQIGMDIQQTVNPQVTG